MAELLVQAKYSSRQCIANLAGLLGKLGVGIQRIWSASGEYDLVAIADVPDNVALSDFEATVLAALDGGAFPNFHHVTTEFPVRRQRSHERLPGGTPRISPSPESRLANAVSKPNLVLEPEPALVPGRPNIYGIHYPNKACIGYPLVKPGFRHEMGLRRPARR